MFGIFYGLSDGHLAYLTAIWYFLWPFGIFCGHLVFSVAIWYFLWPFICGTYVHRLFKIDSAAEKNLRAHLHM
jgi:hypothetical protein